MSESERKIRVVILVNELLRGGAQRIILDVINNIDANRFALTVLYLKSHKNFGDNVQTVEGEIRNPAVRIRSLEGRRMFGLGEAVTLFKFLRAERPDVLHTFLPYAGIVGRVVGRIARVPRIMSTQCNLPIAYGRRLLWLDRLTLPLATCWVGATEGIELSYGGSSLPLSADSWVKGRRHFTIVAGVDLPAFDRRILSVDRTRKRNEIGVSSSEKLLLMVARLVSWKGHASLIEALARLPENVCLALVGWGPLEIPLKQLATDLGVESRVYFLGVREDVPELLVASDVYVQAHGYSPTGEIWMGPNTSQMEACAARVPSVSTAVPLISRLIENGVTGVLAAPDDSADLARAVSDVLGNPERAHAMAVRARHRVEEWYSVKVMVAAYQQIYTLQNSLTRRRI